MKKTVFISLAGLILLLAGLAALGKKVPPKADLSALDEPTGYTLSDKEIRILIQFLTLELLGYAKGWDTISDSLFQSTAPARVTAKDLQRAYERNEVAGDKQFRRQALIVSGTVLSIDRSLGESYSISLDGGTSVFSNPRASMADGYTDYLAELSKGEEVYLACTGAGMLLGSAILSKCYPAEIWAQQQSYTYVAGVGKRLSERERMATVIVLLGVSTAGSIDASSPCLSDGYTPECEVEIDKIIHSMTKADLASTALKLQIDTTLLSQIAVK